MNLKKILSIIIIVAMLASTFLALFLSLAGSAQGEELYFTILHTNDEHSALIPAPLVDFSRDTDNPTLGGFARLASVVNRIRSEKAQVNEDVVLVSAGDFIGGSPYAWLILEGHAPELSLMIEIGYDVITIGNHEYDYGPDILAQYLKRAGYPQAQSRTAIVASNTVPPLGHPLNDLGIKKTHIKTLNNGLKLGFFGLMGIDAVEVAPLAEPVTFLDQVETARSSVRMLEEAGADIIIAINHTSVDEDKDLAAQVDGIHVMVTGHCHTELHEPVLVGDTIIVSAGELLENLGILELAFNPETKKLRIRNNDGFLIPLNHQVGEDPHIAMLVEEYTELLNEYISFLTKGQFTDISQTVVYSDFPLSNKPELQESPFGNFITDAMRLITADVTGERVDFAFQANGVIRGSLELGNMAHSKGKVSFYDLATLVGLGAGHDGKAGYPIVSVYLTGEEVRRVLEVAALLGELMGDTYFLQMSGLRMEYNPRRSVIATIPFLNIPIPSTRAVLRAERYAGEGIQDSDNFVPLNRGDETLYHVVTDYYIAQFLPLAGEVLPSLEIILKDRDGNPISPQEAIVYRDGRELKVWQTVLEFAAAQPRDNNGNPRISEFYNTSEPQRLIVKWTIPLIIWPILILTGLISLIVLFIKRIRRKKQRRLFT